MLGSSKILVPLVLAPLAAPQGMLQSVSGSAGSPQLGTSLARFHDVDGDGWRDVLAGAPGEGLAGSPDGRVLLLSGRYLAQGGALPTTLKVFQGAFTSFGTSVIGLEDLDGNGVWDFAVGDPEAPGSTGFSFPHGAVRFFDIHGTELAKLLGPKAGERFGTSIALLGDLNGDGVRELLIGSPDFSGGIPTVFACGKAAVYSGAAALQGNEVVLRAYLGDQSEEHFGTTLATGWFDGDSVVDYAIGTPQRTSSGGVPDSGRVSVYSGATGNLIRTIHGGGGSRFGASLAGGRDVTGDGVHDLVIGAPHASSAGNESGSAFVYSGAALDDGGLLLPARTWHGPSAGAHFGAAVGLLYDVNGDGDADVVVGAPDFEVPLAGDDNGQMRLYSGETAELLGVRTGLANEHLGGSFAPLDSWDGKPGWEFASGSPRSTASGSLGRVSSWSIFPNTPTTYCTAKTNSLGCTPLIAGLGQPSTAPGTHFNVRATQVVNNVPGILIYALDAAAIPFQGGFLCVGSPVIRSDGTFSGGSPPPAADCSGSLTFDFNAIVTGGGDPTLVAGQEVFAQVWSRDVNASSGSNLTGGLRFLIHP